MNKKIALISFLLFANIAESSFQEENEKEIKPKNSFISNALGKLYYLTSVAGYGSNVIPIFDFLKSHPNLQNFKEKTFEDNACDKEEVESEFKVYTSKLKNLQNKSLSSGNRKLTGTYLYSELENNAVHIISSILKIEFSFSSEQFESCLFPEAQFDISKSSNFSSLFIKELMNDFKGKSIHIFSLLRNDKPAHLCYLDIQIPANQSEMKVMIIDAVPEISYQVGFFDIPKKAKSQFLDISQSLKLDLKFDYKYRYDQILNFHDCGRFSTIYLLNALKGKNIENLTGFDVYNGFKELEKHEYEKFHQTPSLYHPTTEKVSSIAKIFKYTRRIPIDLFLTWWEKKEK